MLAFSLQSTKPSPKQNTNLKIFPECSRKSTFSNHDLFLYGNSSLSHTSKKYMKTCFRIVCGLNWQFCLNSNVCKIWAFKSLILITEFFIIFMTGLFGFFSFLQSNNYCKYFIVLAYLSHIWALWFCSPSYNSRYSKSCLAGIHKVCWIHLSCQGLNILQDSNFDLRNAKGFVKLRSWQRSIFSIGTDPTTDWQDLHHMVGKKYSWHVSPSCQYSFYIMPIIQ